MPRSNSRYSQLYDAEDENEQGVVQVLASYTKNPLVLGGMALVTFLAVSFDATVFYDMFYGDGDLRYQGRLPNSLLTLNYPYTLLRGVVAEQPVEDSDVPFFWTTHKPDAELANKVLNNCYGIETIELDSADAIKKAKEVNMASRRGGKFAITSPYLREVAEIFTPQNLGRTTCFFRHPLDYDVRDELPSYEREDNWLTRYLLNDGTTEVLAFKDLGDAKQIIRDICVTVTLDRLVESIERAADYYGWTLQGSQDCVQESVDQVSTDIKEMDHESDEWNKFYEKYKFDCQLFEFAQQAWRAQIQTVIPLSLQLQRAKRYGNNADEEEDN